MFREGHRIRLELANGDSPAHGESEAALRHVRRYFVTRDSLRRAIARLVGTTFQARDQAW